MDEMGLNVKRGNGGSRIEIQCKHRNGLLYAVPSEATWVCSQELMHAHALAGFFTQLAELDDLRIKEIMQRWGLYFRERPLSAQDEDGANET